VYALVDAHMPKAVDIGAPGPIPSDPFFLDAPGDAHLTSKLVNLGPADVLFLTTSSLPGGDAGQVERPWDNIMIRNASLGSVAASRSPLNPHPAHSSLSPGFTRSFGSKSQEKAGQANDFDGCVTRKAAERERVELERILSLMATNLEIARERIKTCQRLCTSVPLASLQVGTLRDCGGLVCQLEEASENASQEAVEMHRLVESMREAAVERVERAMEQDYSNVESGIANFTNSSFRRSRSSAAHAKESAAAERSVSPRRYTYEQLKQISPGLNPVGLVPDAGGSVRSDAMSPRASWHVSAYVCISAWIRLDCK
jgi:hypothetical protein